MIIKFDDGFCKRMIKQVICLLLIIGICSKYISMDVFAEEKEESEYYTVTIHYDLPEDVEKTGRKDYDEEVKLYKTYNCQLSYWDAEGVEKDWRIDYFLADDGTKITDTLFHSDGDVQLTAHYAVRTDIQRVKVSFDFNGGYRYYVDEGRMYSVEPYTVKLIRSMGHTSIVLYRDVSKDGDVLLGWIVSGGDGTLYKVPEDWSKTKQSLEYTVTDENLKEIKFIAVWKNEYEAKNKEKSTEEKKASDENKKTTTDQPTETKKYSNEWVDGKWYNADGTQTYKGTLTWKNDSTGWWVEDTDGWYPQSSWQKIDGKWYYFTDTGYMDYSEYRDGCWLGSDGAWVEEYYGGHWCSNSTGWWYEDSSGWYPQSQYVWIDGTEYWFGADGYWK